MHSILGASLSKLNELWQEYIKHKPEVHMFLCVHVKAEEVTRDEYQICMSEGRLQG